MERQRVESALARIEAAAARIEAASARPQAVADPALAARHEKLRTTVAASLQELEALIGSLEQ